MRHIDRYYSLRGHEVTFRVTAHLASPVALNDHLCLDSLLAYAVVREEMGEAWKTSEAPRRTSTTCATTRPPSARGSLPRG